MILDMFNSFIAIDLGYWHALLIGMLFWTFTLTCFFVLSSKGKFNFPGFLKDYGLIYAFVAFLLIMGWEFFSQRFFILFCFFQFAVIIWAPYHKRFNKYNLFVLMGFFAIMSWLVTAYPGILY